MLGRLLSARSARVRQSVVTGVGTALLVSLLPTTALALPPSPTAAETGRETLDLESLSRERPVSGQTLERHLRSLKVDIPDDQERPPAGTATPPAPASGQITFPASGSPASGSPASGSPAASRAAGADGQPAAAPVGTLPVRLGQAEGLPAPTGTWTARVHDRALPVGQGVDGAVISVDAPTADAGPLSVTLDYAEFKNLYGADWGSRLRFVQFPDCYLTTPDDEACQAYEELETVNDTATETITATVDPAADGTATPAGATLREEGPAARAAAAAAGGSAVLGAVDSGAGAGGSFKATPLVSSGTWAAGGSSGAFTWAYPLTVPAPPAGPAPEVSFAYNSQTVDGRTAVTSPQASWIGEGWSYDPGHIERRYRSCEEDRKTLGSRTPNNTAKKDKTSDLCWVSDNAVMSLRGRTVELVQDTDATVPAGTKLFRPQQDDGTRVELKTGGTNADDNGEHWIVTTPDGAKHYYGLNKVGGGRADTDSVSTVPVFGNHPGEPCYEPSFADSRCGAGKQQAWRWGLDKVVDVHDNAMVIDWRQASNYYAVRKKHKTPEKYDRAAYPDLIEYGMRASDLTKPSARVDIVSAQRCLAKGTACDGANFDKTADPGAYRPWWDTPGSLNCKATSKLCPSFPSFWTRMRLSEIVTEAQRPGSTALQKVDSYKLHQSFPSKWYDTSPGLWLNAITRTGYGPGDTTGTLQHADGVSFAHYTVGSQSPLRKRLKDRQLPNLVPRNANDPRPAFTRPRIGAVATEHGGDIEVEYTGGCAAEPATDQGKDNTTCYPVRWSPDGDDKKPAKAWFNKYVVDSVTETDKVTTHGTPVRTSYGYAAPAWAKSEDEFTRSSLRTHSDWRGYRRVSVTKGSKVTTGEGSPQPQSYSVSRYFRGTGGEVMDSTGTEVLVADDAPQYAGTPAETITYDGTGGRVLKRTLNRPWSRQTAKRVREVEEGADPSSLLAHRTGIERTDAIQTVGTGWRAVRTVTTVDPVYGLPLTVESAVVKPTGTGTELSDHKCVEASYVHNTSRWLIGLPKERRTTATSCAGRDRADAATEVIEAERIGYDGQGYGADPDKGLVTSLTETDGDGTRYTVETTTSYDPLGRVRKVTQPGGGTTETQYTPGDAGGPLTSTKLINPLGHTSTTTYDPGRSLPLTVTDANGRVTRSEYDALGRLVKGWTPSRAGKSAVVEIRYQPAIATEDETRPPAVTTRTLKDDGSYSSQVSLYDGLGRLVQTQAEAHGPGRIVTDTTYNDHGLVAKQTSGYLAQGDPVPELFEVRSPTQVPRSTTTQYDGLERPVRQITNHGRSARFETRTSYGDTHTTVDPPGESTPAIRTETDALGRVTSVEHYTSIDRSGSRTTTYGYDKRGNRDEVKDPAGSVWSYKYNARGLVYETRDPDTGTSTTRYDAADRPVEVTNGRLQTIHTAYDLLGRVTSVREGDATKPVKEYTYDSLSGAVGKPVATIRNTASGSYVNRVTGYDTDYRPTGRETVIPDSAITKGVSGTYKYGYAYTSTGKPESVTLPAKGGLQAEKVITRYNEDGLAETTSGHAWYTTDVTYSPFGEVLRSVSGAQPYRVWTTNFIDQHSGSLQRSVVDRETSGPHRISDSYYSYDTAGLISSSARRLTDAAGSTWDNQCFTYDVMGELAHAWTSSIAPAQNGTGCKSANGTAWGHRGDAAPSGGPVAAAPDAQTDATAPDASLTAGLAANAPFAGTVSTGAASYRQSFTYDWLGNRATMTEHDPADSANTAKYTYAYGKQAGNGTNPTATVQPHTLTSVASSPAGKESGYTYDATGNTETRDFPGAAQDQTLAWTTENRVDTVTENGVKITYVYDAEGNRVLENSPSGSTLYLGETELTTDAKGEIVRASRSYGQPGAPTVVRTAENGATTGHQRSVMLADHLGTANTAVEVHSGQTVTRRAYKPFGELRGAKPAQWPNKRGYLGVGIDDESTGLTHIGAREYDQTAGRFISADPLIDIGDPLQMNGYAYSNNSPISKSDPSGLAYLHVGGGSSNISAEESQRIIYDMHRDDYGHSHEKALKASMASWDRMKPAEERQYVTVLPGLQVNKTYPGAQRFINSMNRDIDQRRLYNAFPVFAGAYYSELATFQARACHETRVCPGGRGNLIDEARSSKMSIGVGRGLRRPGGGKPGGGKSKSDPCDPNSFTPGTEVLMADGTKKPIEDVKVGDKVLATDPKTGETAAKAVTAEIFGKGAKNLVKITIDLDGSKGERTASVTATDGHPFWVPELGQWIDATKLKASQWLKTSAGTHVQITAVKRWTQQAAVHNLTVADIHTYYVLAGTAPVLVHNCNDEIPDVLHHYTNEGGHDGIKASQELRPSTQAANPNDAKFGDGQYLTDIEPGTKRPGQLSAAFYRVPWLGRRVSHYVSIDVRGLDVRQGRPGVFYILNSEPLDVTGRIVGSGRN
ncbi:HYD1 signature containing ADP-ribosyltransferase family protein [Streptomyces jumonjinensis]|uniref:HYD1 signature containing ADP-ribosyltransferase family protein n=1 Tax=Streptomyces jumonjinensis TaxID=1945 RepID=UPI003796603A